MGLDTSHDCWHGAYSAFMRWREKLAEVAGLPPLRMMEGYDGAIRWDSLKPDALHILLDHSDCAGSLASAVCGPLADSLERLLPLLPNEDGGGHVGPWKAKTQAFIDGLRLAASRGEDVEFH
jgi:hypothetical protein